MLPDVFEGKARSILASESSLVYRWDPVTATKRGLVFPKQCESGFEVRAEAKEFLGFLRTLLSADANLEVHLAGGHPHKWVLNYIDENGPQSETTGLLLFRYWGAREIITRQNTMLSPRYQLP